MKKTLQQFLREDFDKNYKCNVNAEDIIARTDFFIKPVVVENEVILCSDNFENVGNSFNVEMSLQEENSINPETVTSEKLQPIAVSEEVETKQCEKGKINNKFLFNLKAFHSTAVVAATLILVISILTISLITLNEEKNNLIQYADENQEIHTILTESEKEFMKKNSTRMYKLSVFETYINNRTKILLYKGYNIINDAEEVTVYFYKIEFNSTSLENLEIKCNNNTINVTNDNLVGILTLITQEIDKPFDDFAITINDNGTIKNYLISVPNGL